ncbi:uncharacterized protein CTHT_0053080 [Thermochaetoides thermophila DSM 1495]|uniref:MICOS complex subunit n=1 Tax=Chaetomium thermophilum (strain DSM 1495 / CBS 144.50 / IMI 039719) TaxID=759272 RepID=G0SDV0_CHATD|nr:hypothetical protein CTHT_0053080 [Thermochaetoides thermophila DSM 1495]EGS18701.1 hypothetical protein CTHT_0053080 [Thermochaetoides thermophila DSM 1495]
MAARVLLQRRVAPLAAAALVGSVAFAPRIAHAEAPNDRSISRKPIYDDEDFALPPSKPSSPAALTPSEAQNASAAPVSSSEPETTTTIVVHRPPTPTDRLAAQIRRARLFLYAQSCVVEDSVNDFMSRAFALEQSFTSTLASLAPSRESGEKLMPGLIYVLVSGMAGSIVARNRGVLLRATTPLAFGLGAAYYVLPVTMQNVGGLVWEYEKKFPAVADAHIKTREGIEHGVAMARMHADIAQQKVHDGVRSVREALEEWVRKGK